MRYKTQLAFILALLGGIFLAIGYVNPYGSNIVLSELVLQLSGSRGSFTLGFSIYEIVNFAMRLIPNYLFQIFFGIMLYRHFCTASIYVFSRHPQRLRWYFGEAFSLGVIVLFYEVVLLVTVIIVTAVRNQIQMDLAGIILLVYHFILQSTWLYCMTLAINLIAVKGGSSFSFLVVMGIQICCITLLGCVEAVDKIGGIYFAQELLKLNPIAHMVVGWHQSNMDIIAHVLKPPYKALELNTSVLLYVVFDIMVLLVGAVLVKKHDLLISDSEEGGS